MKLPFLPKQDFVRATEFVDDRVSDAISPQGRSFGISPDLIKISINNLSAIYGEYQFFFF